MAKILGRANTCSRSMSEILSIFKRSQVSGQITMNPIKISSNIMKISPLFIYKMRHVIAALGLLMGVGAGYAAVSDTGVADSLPKWNVSQLTESGKTLDTSDKTSNTRCMVLVDNDTRLFVHARGTRNVITYDLSVPGDLSSARFINEFDTSPYLGTGTQSESVGHGIYVKRDTMDRVWLWNRTEVWQFDLSTPGDMTTAVKSGYKDLSAYVTRGHGIYFRPDGEIFYVEDRGQAKVHQFSVSEAWDIETLEWAGDLDISARHRAVRGIEFTPDGKTMFLLDTSLREIQQYNLSEAWQASTAEFDKALSVNIRNPRGITWNSDGSRAYIMNASTGVISQFDIIELPQLPFADHFNKANWRDSDAIPHFWSRSEPGSVISQVTGTSDGRFIQMIETGTQGNRLSRFYTKKQALFNFADQTIIVKLNDIQDVFPSTLEGNYSWYKAWGFADEEKRIDRRGENLISLVHAITSGGARNTLTLYAGEKTLGSLTLAMTGEPVAGNEANVVTPVNIELTLDSANASVSVELSDGTTHTISGAHGFDPKTEEWMRRPVLCMNVFVGSAKGPGTPMGFSMDSITVSSPNPVTVVEAEPPGMLLTWQRDPTTTMTIDWQTNPHIFPQAVPDGTLRYKKVGSDSWNQVQAEPRVFPFSERTVYRVELTGLEPDTEYRFQVNPFTRKYKFRTMPESVEDEPLVFAAGGDTRHRQEWMERMNRVAMEYDPAFVVWGGDMAYEDGRADQVHHMYEWFDAIMNTLIREDGLVIPVIVTIGNHEVIRGYYTRHEGFEETDEWRERIAPYYYALFAFPGHPGYGALDFGNYLSLILLDSHHTNPMGPDSRQTHWLNEVLDERSEVPHLFPVYHLPAYPSSRPYGTGLWDRVRRHWVPIFDKHGIRVAFEHHDHAYKRTEPLRADQIDPHGVVYIGDGAWGVAARAVHDPAETWYLARAQQVRHAIIVTLYGTQQHYLMVAEDGTIIDEYVPGRHALLGIDSSDRFREQLVALQEDPQSAFREAGSDLIAAFHDSHDAQRPDDRRAFLAYLRELFQDKEISPVKRRLAYQILLMHADYSRYATAEDKELFDEGLQDRDPEIQDLARMAGGLDFRMEEARTLLQTLRSDQFIAVRDRVFNQQQP